MDKLNDQQKIDKHWGRYLYCRDRGHSSYVSKARRCEDFYLGAGKQWRQADVEALEAAGRPVMEVNSIFPVVNTAIGLQLKNRLDISFKPRRQGANQETADLLSKISMQIADNNSLPWLETQVYSDGLIQRRGYFDIRISFEDTILGEIEITTLDPLDVIPDPDANDYDPKSWGDVIVVRWMELDEIEQLYGKDKADEVEMACGDMTGEGEPIEDRSSFGGPDTAGSESYMSVDRNGTKRYMIVDRQHRRLQKRDVFVSHTGDIRPVPEGMSPEDIILKAQEIGGYVTKKMIRLVRWTVFTYGVLLHDDWSPYEEFTVVPYFPYFRRGRTRGVVDNAISPQEIFNKTISQFLHIINTSANSGWTVEEDSLANMTTDDLAERGAETGLVLEYKRNRKKPEKITPNNVPTGTDRLADKCELYIKNVTGMSDAMQGLNGPEVSGVALQSKQFMGQTQHAGPLDNLARTRNILAQRILQLIQRWYDSERVLVITKNNGIEDEHMQLAVNQQDEYTGEIINDLTLGEYDVVIDDIPNQATFQNGQFQQAMEMRREGIAIPDKIIIGHSDLSKKKEILQDIEEAIAARSQADPLDEARAETERQRARKLKAETEKTLVDTVGSSVDAQYGAMQSAQVVLSNPLVAKVAERLLGSGGYQDRDAAPIVPQQDLAIQTNTNPMTPTPTPAPNSPFDGKQAGIETPENDL